MPLYGPNNDFYTYSSGTYICYGHEDWREDHWLCEECDRYFPNASSHGHFRSPQNLPDKMPANIFLIEKRNNDMKRFWSNKKQWKNTNQNIKLRI